MRQKDVLVQEEHEVVPGAFQRFLVERGDVRVIAVPSVLHQDPLVVPAARHRRGERVVAQLVLVVDRDDEGERLEARDELMALFDRLANHPQTRAIEDFRSALMDYVCAGHFEVYEHLVEANLEAKELLSALYLAIHDTTKATLVFDDVCTVPESPEELTPLLADLGLRLEERFVLEDQLIEAAIGP